jgi:hypothetical protein
MRFFVEPTRSFKKKSIVTITKRQLRDGFKDYRDPLGSRGAFQNEYD